jgi:glycosyltransferase involved in cell wall biosynthesis
MRKFIFYGKNKNVNVISSSKIDINGMESIMTDESVELNQKFNNVNAKTRMAYVCNWNQQCGISTYSSFILEKLKNKIDEFKIFSEKFNNNYIIETDSISYCWERGKSLEDLSSSIKKFKPSVILLQHEWGIFPNITYFMSFLIEMRRCNIPVIVVMHSVYEHLDKQIPLSVIDNVIIHSEVASDILKKFKFKGKIFLIPHGCPDVKVYEEVWNIFQTPYLIFGFGFGFKYKGIETAIDAVKHLKETDEKFKNILYVYVCSESVNNKSIHDNYYDSLYEKIETEGLKDNVLLIKGFLEPEMLDIYLKTVKMVIFPYISGNNTVAGSSGAIKIAMSYDLPVIASNSNLFSDVDGYVIRTADHLELANEIDKLFSDSNYRTQTIQKSHEFIKLNSWESSSQKYFDAIREVQSNN